MGHPVARRKQRGPTVRVLGPVTVEGVASALTVQQTSLVALLAIKGPQSKDLLIDSLWAGNRVSDSRFANLLTELRGAIGKRRLVYRVDGRYELVEVGCDLDLFAELVGDAGRRPSTGASADVMEEERPLVEALSLVGGRLFEHSGSRYWNWLDHEYHIAVKAEQTVRDVALGLAASASRRAHYGLALWACQQGLLAVPDDEQLIAALVGLYRIQGRQRAGDRLEQRLGRTLHGD